ncbi:PAS domain-containing protein [Cupriavidus basilensis]
MTELRGTDFDALSRLSSDAVLLTVDGRLVRANPAAARLLGAQDAAQLTGLQLAGLIHPDDVAQVIPRLAGMVSSGLSAQPVEHRLVRADYTHVLVASEAAACEHEGQPAVMLVLREAVSRHALERHAVQARAEALHARRLLASENAVLAQLAPMRRCRPCCATCACTSSRSIRMPCRRCCCWTPTPRP